MSNLVSSDISSLLEYINKMDFLYRDILSIDSNITFGNEIEVNGIDNIDMYRLLKRFNDENKLFNNSDKYMISDDITVDTEVITPILTNNKYNWIIFKKVYDLINDTSAYIDEHTSSHIHIGMHLINSYDQLSLFLKTLVVFEPIIFMFGYGYGDKPRQYITADSSNYSVITSPKRFSSFIDYLDNNHGCNDELFNNFLGNELHLKDTFRFDQFDIYNVNKENKQVSEDNHIEVRCFNGSLDPVIVQNNISLITGIMDALINNRLDKDYINFEYLKYKKLEYNFDQYGLVLNYDEKIKYNSILNSFSNIDINKAIRLADMIYTNDRDKYYFLKQYMKLFNSSDDYLMQIKRKL